MLCRCNLHQACLHIESRHFQFLAVQNQGTEKSEVAVSLQLLLVFIKLSRPWSQEGVVVLLLLCETQWPLQLTLSLSLYKYCDVLVKVNIEVPYPYAKMIFMQPTSWHQCSFYSYNATTYVDITQNLHSKSLYLGVGGGRQEACCALLPYARQSCQVLW